MTTVQEIQERSAELRQFFDQHLPYARPTPVLADFVRVQHELMWGGVWLADGLDLKLRSFATITSQCVNGYDFGVEHQVRTGLTVGITAQQIKGIFIQLLFYAGRAGHGVWAAHRPRGDQRAGGVESRGRAGGPRVAGFHRRDAGAGQGRTGGELG